MERFGSVCAHHQSQVEAGYDDPEKSDLFFKLHQLQTGSWGISRIGRVTQAREATNTK